MTFIILRLIRILIFGLIFYYLYRVLWKGEKPLFFMKKKKSSNPSTSTEIIAEMKKDPVCGTYIPENQAIRLSHGKDVHYFCSEECKEQFRQKQKEAKK